jgi:hypothetical protein
MFGHTDFPRMTSPEAQEHRDAQGSLASLSRGDGEYSYPGGKLITIIVAAREGVRTVHVTASADKTRLHSSLF